VLLPKIYGYGRRKRSKLVPFLGDLGLLIRRDSGKIRWEKSRIYWASLFALCSISTELVDKIGAPLGSTAVGCVWGLLAPYT
jgi:hypothetical protein